LMGANSDPQIAGLDELPGKVNYYGGDDPREWATSPSRHTNIPTFSKVKYTAVYPGVDLIYYGNQRQLEYDFIVGPGADTKSIQLSFDGVQKLRIDKRGDLVAQVAKCSEVRWHKPVIYQDVNGARHEIAGGYFIKGKHEVSFEIGEYDKSKPLVIDPKLIYSTFLGGLYTDNATAIAVDSAGNAIIAGRTDDPVFFSTNFPLVNPLPGNAVFSPIPGARPSGNKISFLTKLNADGTAFVYSTLLGSRTVVTNVTGIAVDAADNAYVTGTAFLAGARVDQRDDHSLAFVAKISPTGNVLYSFILVDDEGTGPTAIAVDATGSAYVTGGTTFSPTHSILRATSGAFQALLGGNEDAFVAKINPAGTALVYATYLGGSSDEDVGFGIAVDDLGNAYVTGYTKSINFPLENPLQSSFAGLNPGHLYSGGMPL
jgi:hypothetical protein